MLYLEKMESFKVSGKIEIDESYFGGVSRVRGTRQKHCF